ncbi:MAG: polymer-forming cytoskeletal protein [Caldilineae bacterium]|nr:MAG: polymer-forming cytoskeletal protein [Caldilineae bacterium]
MFRRQRRPEPDRIQLTIGKGVTVRGEIRCDGSVRVDGVIEGGRIETLGNVIIGEEGQVLADVRADAVSVAGLYKGEMEAKRVELLAGGKMWGTVRTGSIYLDEGAYMHAELVMLSETPPAEPAEPEPYTPPEVEWPQEHASS